MGEEYVAEGLLKAFAAHNLSGKRILLPRAAVAQATFEHLVGFQLTDAQLRYNATR